jgi:outer membrane protein assembly factor BamB/PKD repeat protein
MEKKIIGIVLCTLLVATAFVSAATPQQNSTRPTHRDDIDWWPTNGHDNRHTGFSTSSGPITSTLLVNTQPISPGTSNAVYSGPVVTNGKLYMGFYDQPTSEVYCTDAFSGALLWRKSLLEVYASPVIDDNKLYAYGWGPDYAYTALFCLNADTGSTIWEFVIPDFDSILASPIVAEGKIYFCTVYDQLVYCLNSNGTVAWSSTASQFFSSPQASPAIYDGKLYVAASDFYLGPTAVYCYDITDGALIWTYTTTKGPAKTPTIANGNIVLGIGDTMFCFDAAGNGDGTTDVLWSYPTTGAITCSATAYGNVFFGTSSTGVYCVNANTGALVWNYQTLGAPTAPALADDKVYVITNSGLYGSEDNQMYCLDAIGNGNGTTNMIWHFTLPDHNAIARGQPAIGLGTVWVATDKNWIFAISDNHPPVRPVPPTGPSQGYTGVEYTFSATTTDPDNDNVSYLWDWNDGAYSNWSDFVSSGATVTASHTWDTAGSYFVKVQVRDEIGFSSLWSIGHFITILPYQAMAVEAHGPYSGNIGEMIQFTGNVTGGAPEYSWHWDFGNGNTSDVQNPTYAYLADGTYTVTLTVIDAAHNTASDTALVTIINPAAPNLTIDAIVGGFGVSAVIMNKGTANATNISWSIALTGGFILIGNETIGTIANIPAGGEATIKSSLIVGLGKSVITVTATCNEGSVAEKTANGVVILFFVIGVQ